MFLHFLLWLLLMLSVVLFWRGIRSPSSPPQRMLIVTEIVKLTMQTVDIRSTLRSRERGRGEMALGAIMFWGDVDMAM